MCGVMTRPSSSEISSILNSILPSVDADHGGHVCHPDMIVAAHDVGNGACLDAVVHRDSALVRNRILERDVFHRFEDVVVLLQHVCLLKGLVKGRWVGLRCEIGWNLQAKLCSNTLDAVLRMPQSIAECRDLDTWLRPDRLQM